MSETNGYASITDLTTPRGRRYKSVEHPEFGKYMLESIDSLERSSYEGRIQVNQISEDRERLKRSLVDMKERLIVMMVVDPQSKKKLLTYDHIPMLQKQDSAMIDWLAEECSQFAGFSKKDMEELTKN